VKILVLMLVLWTFHYAENIMSTYGPSFKVQEDFTWNGQQFSVYLRGQETLSGQTLNFNRSFTANAIADQLITVPFSPGPPQITFLNLQGRTLPAYQLRDGDNSVALSLQYAAVPLMGHLTYSTSQGKVEEDFRLNGENVTFTASSSLLKYEVNLTVPPLSVELFLYSPTPLSLNVTPGRFSSIWITSNSFLSVLIPSQTLNSMLGIARLDYDGQTYFLDVSPQGVQYFNYSNPFMAQTFQGFAVISFPRGGEVVITFANAVPIQSYSISHQEITVNKSPIPVWIAAPVVVAAIIAVVIAYKIPRKA